MQKKRSKVTIVLTIIIIVLALVAGVFIYKYVESIQNDPQHQNTELVSQIGRSVSLPSEQPTVATIIDRTKLSSATLRSTAHNGDKLLIYTKAKELLLYRPSTKKVVTILSIVNTSQATQPGGSVDTTK